MVFEDTIVVAHIFLYITGHTECPETKARSKLALDPREYYHHLPSKRDPVDCMQVQSDAKIDKWM